MVQEKHNSVDRKS